MAYQGKTIAGFVLLAVGATLLLAAIILIICLLHRRKKTKYMARSASPDTFKVVYKVPTTNGFATKSPSDMFDGKSTHTLARSEPGYAYVPPPSLGRPATQSLLLTAPPMTAHTLPRATSVDHLRAVPRPQYQYATPTYPRMLVPVTKKKARRVKYVQPKPLYVPVYNTSQSMASVPEYATSARSATSRNPKYYMYGSTPNIHAANFTQPVLMYDKKKQYFMADEVTAGRNQHVENWLHHDLHHDHPNSPHDNAEYVRPRSIASSAPTDLEVGNDRDHTNNSLYLKWSPSMRKKMQDKDRREAAIRSDQASHTLAHEVMVNGTRKYQPLHHYTELSETF